MCADKPITSQIFAAAGGLMTVSGILMALGENLAYGGIMWASASLLFFAAHSFRMVENRRNH